MLRSHTTLEYWRAADADKMLRKAVMSYKYCLITVVMTFGCISVTAYADTAISVRIETEPLAFYPQPLAVNFQLTDGSGSGDTNNKVSIGNFNFGIGGGPLGSPSRVGGAIGSLAGSVILSDSSFFNSFSQQFKASNFLDFDVSFTNNRDGGLTPDEFSFAILDALGRETVTTDAFETNVLLRVDFNSDNPSVQRFSSTVVPEPTALGLLSIGFIVMALYRLRPLLFR